MRLGLGIRAISLFSGGGIGESRLDEIGIHVELANEVLEARREIFEALNPKTRFLVSDIRDPNTKSEIFESSAGVELVLATPPCQGVSIAGKNRSKEKRTLDPRNFLLFDTIEIIKNLDPKFVLIENVPQFLDLHLPFDGRLTPMLQILENSLGRNFDIDHRVINVSSLGVPQDRNRAFIALQAKGETGFVWPEPQPAISVHQAIGHLPSLEAGEASDIPLHFARKHDIRQIEWMRHTPTGATAFDNPVHFPRKLNGERVKAYRTTYRRMAWDKPAPAITMRNDAISSQANVHPGRPLGKGIYSDARVLTPLEIGVLSTIKTDSLSNTSFQELNWRRAVGEAVPPLAVNSILRGLKR